MNTRSAGDFILSFSCESCRFLGYGWYSDLRREHEAHSPACFVEEFAEVTE